MESAGLFIAVVPAAQGIGVGLAGIGKGFSIAGSFLQSCDAIEREKYENILIIIGSNAVSGALSKPFGKLFKEGAINNLDRAIIETQINVTTKTYENQLTK